MIQAALSKSPFVVLALALLWPAAASASHYRLPAAGLVSGEETKSLNAANVHTTVDLLERTASVKDRKKLVRQTRISFVRLTELATQCDLLRIKGVGPSMVRLLQAAGVRHTMALKAASAGALMGRLEAANNSHRITEVLPDVTQVAAWIASAKGLEARLEGIR